MLCVVRISERSSTTELIRFHMKRRLTGSMPTKMHKGRRQNTPQPEKENCGRSVLAKKRTSIKQTSKQRAPVLGSSRKTTDGSLTRAIASDSLRLLPAQHHRKRGFV